MVIKPSRLITVTIACGGPHFSFLTYFDTSLFSSASSSTPAQPPSAPLPAPAPAPNPVPAPAYAPPAPAPNPVPAPAPASAPPAPASTPAPAPAPNPVPLPPPRYPPRPHPHPHQPQCSEPDLCAGIDVSPPAPPPVTTTTPATAPVVSKAGAKEASPSSTMFTARNLCLAVWCAEVGGSVASFNVYWDGIKKDKKLSQAYENYAKTLKKGGAKAIPEARAIRDAVSLGPAADTPASSSGFVAGHEGLGTV
ncbi:hypothetical protein C8R45DRAFT_1215031 [Mycena sanguinolenta]|nr:hypothetical protein C8R45DRAFT_1215031 [Mycena sanguinolenta]